MDALSTTSLTPLLSQGLGFDAAGQAVGSIAANGDRQALREGVGEFVGGVFYGALLRQMQNSTLKGKYFHGGRGEDAFQGQLNLELARKLGQAKNNPVADRLLETIERRLGREGPASLGESGAVAAASGVQEMEFIA